MISRTGGWVTLAVTVPASLVSNYVETYGDVEDSSLRLALSVKRTVVTAAAGAGGPGRAALSGWPSVAPLKGSDASFLAFSPLSAEDGLARSSEAWLWTRECSTSRRPLLRLLTFHPQLRATGTATIGGSG